jgi:hypothetical protein
MPRLVSPLVLAILSLGPASRALADDASDARIETEILAGRLTRQERPFAFVVDPSTPSVGVTSFEYRAGFASGMNADRPLPAALTSAGGSHAFTLGYGLTRWLAPYATATVFDDGKKANFLAGARIPLTSPDARLRATVLAAGFREAESTWGAQLTAAASADAGPLRVAGNLQVEKAFASGRDSLDVMVTAGTSVRVASALRLGVEYVGQDLEGAFQQTEAEGGARSMVGPDLALDLDGGRYQLAIAGGIGLTRQTPRALVRAQLAFAF